MFKKTLSIALAFVIILLAASCGADPGIRKDAVETKEGNIVFNDELRPINFNGYLGAKVVLNGADLDPKDAKGNPVEIFSVNGFTYVPAEIIAEMLGMDVEWDEADNALYIGSPVNEYDGVYLGHGIRHLSYSLSGGACLVYDGNFYAVIDSPYNEMRGTITDNTGREYTRFLALFSRQTASWFNYPLDEQYKRFKADVALPDIFKDDADVFALRIYGDTRLLYVKEITAGHVPEKLDVDVSGVSILRIEFLSLNVETIAGMILGNARLIK